MWNRGRDFPTHALNRCAAFAPVSFGSPYPPLPFSPVKFSALMLRVCAFDRRLMLCSPTPSPLNVFIRKPHSPSIQHCGGFGPPLQRFAAESHISFLHGAGPTLRFSPCRFGHRTYPARKGNLKFHITHRQKKINRIFRIEQDFLKEDFSTKNTFFCFLGF